MCNSISRQYCLTVLALLVFQVACVAIEERPLAQLFQEILIKEGDGYLKARDELVARGDSIKPFLNQVTQTSRDWHEKLAARILLGWLDNAKLYNELWDWRESPNYFRNPLPFYYREAHARFSKEGEKAILIMLELIWKKDESHYGALPALLAEANVEIAIPVLVRKKTGFPEAVGKFGSIATPYILEVLGNAEPSHRSWLIQALGHTGGERAVSELRYRLTSDNYSRASENAAISLGELGEYAILRAEYSKLERLHIRLAILEALSKDRSDETRTLLKKVATTAPRAKDGEPYNTERLRAVQAMLKGGTDNDISAVCAIAPAEPHEYTRACIYLYLSRPGVPLVRETLLKALQDSGPWVRIRAIEGLKHYTDDLVTLRVLETIEKSDDPRCRRAGIFMLKERASSRIRKAAEEWLKDKDPEIQRWATEALAKNPASDAGR